MQQPHVVLAGAVRTPIGYRCRECVKGQQKAFDTSEWFDYLTGFAVAAILSAIAAFLASLIARIGFFGWFLIAAGAPSAAVAIAGALLGITLCFAGGNIGDGPGWWVVVFSAGVATAGLFAAWLLLEALTGISDTVTIDRDLAAGVRLGGLLVACGLRLGWAVAGDWISAEATLRDFAANAWLVLVLLAIAVLVERVARHSDLRQRCPSRACLEHFARSFSRRVGGGAAVGERGRLSRQHLF